MAHQSGPPCLLYKGEAFHPEPFRAALESAGAVILEPTSVWEVLRYRFPGGRVGIVYRDAKGRISLMEPAKAHFAQWQGGTLAASQPPIARAATIAAGAATLYTDAGFYLRTKSGSWAAILVDCDGKEHEVAGALKGDVRSSSSAELAAIANAIHYFLKRGLIPARLRVVTDSTAAMNVIKRGTVRRPSSDLRAALEYIKGLAARGITIEPEWVKAHQPPSAAATDPRVGYNRRCDKLARSHSEALHASRLKAKERREDASGTMERRAA